MSAHFTTRILTTFFVISFALTSYSADFTCHVGATGMLYLGGLQSEPASISSIYLTENLIPKDILIGGVSEAFDSVSIEFVNLETASAFNFQVTKSEIESDQFVVNLFELGSPGSLSQNHVLSCVKQ